LAFRDASVRHRRISPFQFLSIPFSSRSSFIAGEQLTWVKSQSTKLVAEGKNFQAMNQACVLPLPASEPRRRLASDGRIPTCNQP